MLHCLDYNFLNKIFYPCKNFKNENSLDCPSYRLNLTSKKISSQLHVSLRSSRLKVSTVIKDNRSRPTAHLTLFAASVANRH